MMTCLHHHHFEFKETAWDQGLPRRQQPPSQARSGIHNCIIKLPDSGSAKSAAMLPCLLLVLWAGTNLALAADGHPALINCPQKFLAALQDPAVDALYIQQDLDLSEDGFAGWEALSADLVLTRNLTIYGGQKHGQYPMLSFGFWKHQSEALGPASGTPVKHGISLGEGVVLVLVRLLLKKTAFFIPDMIYDIHSSAQVVIYDCIKHTYTGPPPAAAIPVLMKAPRSNASPGTNNIVDLPAGYCRHGPKPAMCWTPAYMVVDMALDSQLRQNNQALVPTIMSNMAVVYEQPVDDACVQQFNAGNLNCILQKSDELTLAEAASPTGWLQPPATRQQLKLVASSLSSVPSGPISPYISVWLLTGDQRRRSLIQVSRY